MNGQDFNRWWSDVKLCFPSIAQWIARTFPDVQTQTALLRKWAGVLADVSIDNALEVNRAMLSGDLEFFGSGKEREVFDSDRERLPQHVRKLARQMAFERRERTPEQFDEKPSSFPAGKILRRMAEMREAGFTRDDAMAAALKEFPIGRPTWEPRYHCHLCFDAGSIDVAPPWAVRAMLEGRFEQCHHRNASARCKCRPPLPANSRFVQATYDAAACFRIHDLQWPGSQVVDFRDWCEVKRGEFWNSRREPAFDSFNQRQFN